jgi:hypothetical protein
LTAYHDTNLDPTMRPEKYESTIKPPQNAWGKNTNGVPNAWGQQSKQSKGGRVQFVICSLTVSILNRYHNI